MQERAEMNSKVGSSAREKLRVQKERPMRKATSSPLTRKQKAELEALRRLPENKIDTSRAPEITDWSDARRGVFYKPLKQQLTLRLDADLVEWFKAQRGGSTGYQTRINQALREYVKQHRRKIA
jgi:uncharacterized protein (DUF4415 family)